MTETSILKDGYPRGSPFVTFLLFVYVFAYYTELGTRIELLGKIRFEFILGLVLGILSIFTGKLLLLGNNRNVFFAVLFLYITVAVQVPLSQDLDQSIKIFLDRFLKLSCMAIFIVAFVRSPVHLKIFLAGFLLACMKLGQEGLVGKLTGSMIWENQGVMRLHGQGAIYGHPNSLSGMALGTIPFLYYYFPRFGWPIKFAILVQFLFAMNIVVFTGSRTGYVGLLGILAYIFLKGGKKFRILLIIGCLLVVGAYIVPGQYIRRFETIYTGKEIEGASMDGRKIVMMDALEIFIANPLGVGVGAFPRVRQRTFGRFADTHNLYLEILTNIGIQGGIAFFVLIIILYNNIGCLEKQYKILIEQMEEISKYEKSDVKIKFKLCKHMSDIRFLQATCQSVKLFLLLRLILGIFGMDLYEIYWWFVIGLTLAIGNIYSFSEIKTAKFKEFIVQ